MVSKPRSDTDHGQVSVSDRGALTTTLWISPKAAGRDAGAVRRRRRAPGHGHVSSDHGNSSGGDEEETAAEEFQVRLRLGFELTGLDVG